MQTEQDEHGTFLSTVIASAAALLISLSISAQASVERAPYEIVIATEIAGAGIGYLAGGIVGFLVIETIAPRGEANGVPGPGSNQLADSVALLVAALVGISAAAIGATIAVGMGDRPMPSKWIAVPAAAVGGGIIGGIAGGIVSQLALLPSPPFYELTIVIGAALGALGGTAIASALTTDE